MRGEGPARSPGWRREGGAPPRAWGRACPCTGYDPPVRSTPTCVGKGGRTAGRSGHVTEHPHVRGEGGGSFHGSLYLDGAPPRAWGRGVGDPAIPVGARSTPTCVGKGRPCGTSALPFGAPPRAWGRDRQRCRGASPRRSTPTCVGKGSPIAPAAEGPTEHPHVRGEGTC